MHKIFTIRPIVTIAFLLLLIFSSTPTQYLHKLFGHHTHKTVKTNTANQAQVSAQVASCQCENTFIDVTYIPTVATVFTVIKLNIGHFNTNIAATIFKTFFAPKSLRAPPALA